MKLGWYEVQRPMPATPFFSPDGEWVGFFDDGLLKKVSVGGGTPITLAAAPGNRGGTWNEDGVIVFASPTRAPLSQISEDGGTPELVTVLDTEWGETSHRQPAFLPGGHAVVFLAEGTGRKSRVVVHSFETGERHVLVDDATRRSTADRARQSWLPAHFFITLAKEYACRWTTT